MTAKRRGYSPLIGKALECETFVRADYQAILQQVAKIPPGKVATYGQIAWLSGLPGRARLVGRVLGTLPQWRASLPDEAVTETRKSAANRASGSQASTASSARESTSRSSEKGVAIPGETAVDSPTPGPALHGRSQASTASSARESVLACPWYRVINSQGKVSLPINSASYLEQRRRLREEGVLFKGGRIDLKRYQWRSLDDSPLLD